MVVGVSIVHRATSLAVAAAFLCTACGGTPAQQKDPTPVHRDIPEQEQHGRGRQPALRRIISLAPSNTELVYALGAQDRLVGVSRFCDFPPQARAHEIVGDFVSVRLESVARLKPDAVLLVDGQEPIKAALEKQGISVIEFANRDIKDIPLNLRRLGELTGQRERAAQLCAAFEHSIAELESIVRRSAPVRVFFALWPHPLITAGRNSFLNEACTACGGINVAGDAASSYAQYSHETLILSQPDVIVFANEAGRQDFWRKPPWSSIRAIESGRFHFLPSPEEDGLSRPTLRVVDGLHWLALKLHPHLQPELDKWHENAVSSLNLGLTGGQTRKALTNPPP